MGAKGIRRFVTGTYVGATDYAIGGGVRTREAWTLFRFKADTHFSMAAS